MAFLMDDANRFAYSDLFYYMAGRRGHVLLLPVVMDMAETLLDGVACQDIVFTFQEGTEEFRKQLAKWTFTRHSKEQDYLEALQRSHAHLMMLEITSQTGFCTLGNEDKDSLARAKRGLFDKAKEFKGQQATEQATPEAALQKHALHFCTAFASLLAYRRSWAQGRNYAAIAQPIASDIPLARIALPHGEVRFPMGSVPLTRLKADVSYAASMPHSTYFLDGEEDAGFLGDDQTPPHLVALYGVDWHGLRPIESVAQANTDSNANPTAQRSICQRAAAMAVVFRNACPLTSQQTAHAEYSGNKTIGVYIIADVGTFLSQYVNECDKKGSVPSAVYLGQTVGIDRVVAQQAGIKAGDAKALR